MYASVYHVSEGLWFIGMIDICQCDIHLLFEQDVFSAVDLLNESICGLSDVMYVVYEGSDFFTVGISENGVSRLMTSAETDAAVKLLNSSEFFDRNRVERKF